MLELSGTALCPPHGLFISTEAPKAKSMSVNLAGMRDAKY